MKTSLSTAQLREAAWALGQHFPEGPTGDYLAFTPIRTGLAYLNWSMRYESVENLQNIEGESFNGSTQALRVYDVSLVEFDGLNAHSFFDVEVDGLTGHYYLHSDQVERTLIAETGFRLRDGRWKALARSVAVFMDRNHRVSHADTAGLYVAGRFDRVFPVENIYHAPVYARMHQLWNSSEGRDLVVGIEICEAEAEQGERLRAYLESVHDSLAKFGITIQAEGSLDLIHQHGISEKDGKRRTSVPLILSLHTTERDRAGMQARDPDQSILMRERKALEHADLVIVPHGDMRDRILHDSELREDKIVILPDLFENGRTQAFDPGEVKKRYHLNPAQPLVLFCGEISHAGGADLLAGAIEHIGSGNQDVQFIFVGEGHLKGELEGRFHHNGMGGRVRFIGDLWHGAFEDVLAACDFAIIPARTWQDEAFAHAALAAGKPVIATHQSRIHCVHHGENGYMVYDNPGSIIWGLEEMLANPFQTGPGGIVRRPKNDQHTYESIAAELAIFYRDVFRGALKRKEANYG